MFGLYYCFPALSSNVGKFHYFPGFFAHRVVDQMKIFHEAKVRGVFLEHSGEFGATYLMDQLEFYLTFKLADDPGLDGNQLIEEFFTRYYGSAAAPMKALYCAIEDTYSNPASYPESIRTTPAHQHPNRLFCLHRACLATRRFSADNTTLCGCNNFETYI